MRLQSKLPYVEKHIFSHMTALSNEFGAVNLSQGFPDFAPDARLLELANAFMNEGANQYAPMPGLLVLREQIARKISADYNVNVDPDSEITIGTGATEMIFSAIMATVWPGDEVIIIEPCYDCYRPAIDLAGAKTVVYKMRAPEFKVDWEEFKKLITSKTRMICICTPNNPTGTVLGDSDMKALCDIVEATDILIMSDEVYGHIVFDGREMISPMQYPELRKRTFSCFSFGKTFHVTGWKVGYCVAPEILTYELRKVHQNATYCASHPMQKAIGLYLEQFRNPDPVDFFEQKRDLLLQASQGTKLKPLRCEGAYFQLFDFSDISSESDFDFCVRLIRENGVAAIPVSHLYSDRHDGKLIRLCFAKKEETLIEAGKRLVF